MVMITTIYIFQDVTSVFFFVSLCSAIVKGQNPGNQLVNSQGKALPTRREAIPVCRACHQMINPRELT